MRFFPVTMGYNDHDSKLFWFCGVLPNSRSKNLTLSISLLIINFYIWETKLKKTRLSLAALEMELNHVLSKCLQISRKLRQNLQKIDMPIFRKWQNGRAGAREGESEDEDEEED
jgi:hypothetical protein